VFEVVRAVHEYTIGSRAHAGELGAGEQVLGRRRCGRAHERAGDAPCEHQADGLRVCARSLGFKV
jgi:hypothetical protein